MKRKKMGLAISTLLIFVMMSTSVFAQIQTDVRPDNKQIKIEMEKAKKAETYVKEKREKSKKNKGLMSVMSATSRINPVGTYRQAESYTCGPASARNLIYGYVQAQGGTVPTETTLKADLGTTTQGTGFDATKWENTLNNYAPGNGYLLKWGTSNWEYDMGYRVIYTIDQGTTIPYPPYSYFTDGYNVIGDMYYENGVSDAMDPVYDKNFVAHYICIYGYDDSTDMYYISDSNSQAPVQYQASYSSTAMATQQRGIIW